MPPCQDTVHTFKVNNTFTSHLAYTHENHARNKPNTRGVAIISIIDA